MGKAKKTRKFAAVKRVMSSKEVKKSSPTKSTELAKKKDPELVKEIPQISSALFFQFNQSLSPPYQVLIDTNFINFSIRKKIDIFRGMMDALYAKCIPMITDCVMAELEKLGPRYRIALRIARDEQIERVKCSHNGTYADDCLVARVMQHKCYIVATNDADLKRRIRKIPGVPILSVGSHSYVVERLPDAF
ncbi:Fcf1-domain-containing protein [Lipomyces chichibuensis]|uniref:Fcf1-domain-containing protein n=1 Tax=Lipomyces chichibuensis TaxID=1546026 RepID=UPI0033436E04